MPDDEPELEPPLGRPLPEDDGLELPSCRNKELTAEFRAVIWVLTVCCTPLISDCRFSTSLMRDAHWLPLVEEVEPLGPEDELPGDELPDVLAEADRCAEEDEPAELAELVR